MQTFLPYPDFAQSASVLDYRRLGKQRVESLQMIRGQWKNHPAAKMWAGYREALALYSIAICEEWIIGRGYRDTCRKKIMDEMGWTNETIPHISSVKMPPWLGDPAFHASHRSNLLRKDKEYYSEIWPDEPDDLEYVWPE